MPKDFQFESIVTEYNLHPELQRQLPHGKTRRWVSSLIGASTVWEYAAVPGNMLLLRAAQHERVRPGHIDFNTGYIDFRYKPNGELILEERIQLIGDEFLDQGVYFPDAMRRGMAIFPPGEYHDVFIPVPFLGRDGTGPMVVEFFEAVCYVSLTLIPTIPYVLQIFRETEENVTTYRDMRVMAEFRADRSDINRIAFGHALPLIAIEELYFER